MKRILLTLVLLALAFGAVHAQENKGVWVDSTYIAPDGQVIRYQGYLKPGDLHGMAKAQALQDDRVPLGYGWKSLRTWSEGDLRPEPATGDTFAGTEFFHLHFDDRIQLSVAMAFLEYTDFVYFGIRESMDWVLEGPIHLIAAWDTDEYGRSWGLPWWVPGDLRGDSIVVQPMAMLTGRGIAMESLTHLYVEYMLRRKTGDRLPQWFSYGLGAYLGNEGWILKGQAEILDREYEIEIDQAKMVEDLKIYRNLDLHSSANDVPGGLEDERITSRIAYWRSFRLMESIVAGEGLSKVKMLVGVMESVSQLKFEAAVKDIYGKSVDELVAEYDPWKE